MGLFACKSLIEASGGTIEAYSDGEGTGACFDFTLPMKVNTRNIPVNSEIIVFKRDSNRASRTACQIAAQQNPNKDLTNMAANDLEMASHIISVTDRPATNE